MPHPERYYANMFIQLIVLILLSIYVYLCANSFPLNVYWLILSTSLFFYGYFRSLGETLMVCIFCILIYSGFIIYRTWLASMPIEVSWNELIWLAIFPFLALIGGINRGIHTPEQESFSFFDLQNSDSSYSAGPCMVEERLGYLSGTAFLYKLEEEVLLGLRDRRKFHLLVIEIEQFREYKRLFGTDQAQLILNLVAEWFKEFATDARAQVGEAVLAAILSAPDSEVIQNVQEQLDNQFYEMMINRPRREGTIKLKLKYGFAECPSDGIEAAALMEKTRIDLSWNGL